MNKLSIASIVLAVLALGIGVYHLVETQPNEEAFRDMIITDSGEIDVMARDLARSYEEASDIQGIAIAALASIGLILGLIGFVKSKGVPAIIAIVLNLGALLIPLITKTHMFS